MQAQQSSLADLEALLQHLEANLPDKLPVLTFRKQQLFIVEHADKMCES